MKKSRVLSSAGQRLKYIRSILGVTRAYIEQVYDLPEVTLKAWENNKISVTHAGIKRCIEVYKGEGLLVSEAWIIEGIGLDPTSTISVSQYFSEPTKKKISLENDEMAMLQDANAFKEKYSSAVIMLVSNDDMRPFFKPGDYVGGKMRFGKDILKCINKNCIIRLKNQDIYFRRLMKNSKDNFNLACLNPNETTEEPVIYDVEIEGAAPIIWHRCKDE